MSTTELVWRTHQPGTHPATKTYHGICPLDSALRVDPEYLVVIAWPDEPELWLVDGKHGLDVLKQYYENEVTFGQPVAVPFTVLRQVVS